MLIEFQRIVEGGEDGTDRGPPIAINPAFVAVVHGSEQRPDMSLIHLADGRGYKVKGSYADVMAKINRLQSEHFIVDGQHRAQARD
jgi:hypothetical protein